MNTIKNWLSLSVKHAVFVEKRYLWNQPCFGKYSVLKTLKKNDHYFYFFLTPRGTKWNYSTLSHLDLWLCCPLTYSYMLAVAPPPFMGHHCEGKYSQHRAPPINIKHIALSLSWRNKQCCSFRHNRKRSFSALALCVELFSFFCTSSSR